MKKKKKKKSTRIINPEYMPKKKCKSKAKVVLQVAVYKSLKQTSFHNSFQYGRGRQAVNGCGTQQLTPRIKYSP